MPSRPYAWQQRQEHSRQLLSRGERTLPTAVTKASYLSIIYLPTYLSIYLSGLIFLAFLDFSLNPCSHTRSRVCICI